jgi:DNA-binding transcriptional LysR family regulator
MADPTLRQLRTLIEAVEAGSLSAAARRLGLTQPAVSQQLRELERLCGLRLLEREGQRTLPTAAGAAMLVHARRIRDVVEEAAAEMAAHRAGGVGRVRLGTGATVCIYQLPPALAAAKRSLPGLGIAITTGNSPEIVQGVAEGALDLAIVTATALPRGLAAEELPAHEMLALFSEAAAPPRGFARPADLAALPLILHGSAGATRGVIDAWFARAGPVPRPAMELDSYEAIKALVAGGLGCTVLPDVALGAAAPAGSRALTLRPALRRRQLLLLRRGKVVDRGLRAVLDAIAGSFGDQPRRASKR